MDMRAADGEVRRHRITGADETGADSEAVCWASPPGRKLLSEEVGDKVTPDMEGVPQKFAVVRIW